MADILGRVLKDADATLPVAQADAKRLLKRGARRVLVMRTRIKAPSGVIDFRFFASDSLPKDLVVGDVYGPSTVVEVLTP